MDPKQQERALSQLKYLCDQESHRAEAVRARCESLLGRQTWAVLPLSAALGLALSLHAPQAVVALSLSAGFLLASMLLTLKNLGFEEYYSPIALKDLLGGIDDSLFTPIDHRILVAEYFKSASINERYNNDAIDRRHLAHGAFVAAVIAASIGLALASANWMQKAADASATVGLMQGHASPDCLADSTTAPAKKPAASSEPMLRPQATPSSAADSFTGEPRVDAGSGDGGAAVAPGNDRPAEPDTAAGPP